MRFMTKHKYLTRKLTQWLRSHDDDMEYTKPDDPHDPQVKTYIYGNATEQGEWAP